MKETKLEFVTKIAEHFRISCPFNTEIVKLEDGIRVRIDNVEFTMYVVPCKCNYEHCTGWQIESDLARRLKLEFPFEGRLPN